MNYGTISSEGNGQISKTSIVNKLTELFVCDEDAQAGVTEP